MICVNQESQKSSSSSSSSSSKKPNISILSGYNHGWKSRHHHFLKYSDVKYKEEKKSTVSDIANQKYVTQKINGWKIYHLSAQMEDLVIYLFFFKFKYVIIILKQLQNYCNVNCKRLRHFIYFIFIF